MSQGSQASSIMKVLIVVGTLAVCAVCVAAIGAGAWYFTSQRTLAAEVPQSGADLPDGPISGHEVASQGGTDRVVIYQDDFSDPASGWERERTDDFLIDYAEGGKFLIQITGSDWDAWGTAEQNFQDVSIEVDATIVDTSNNLFGLICRHRSEANLYKLQVSADGAYEIGRYLDGEYTSLIYGIDQTGAVFPPNTPNRIRADCIGPTISLYANGTLLATVNDYSLGSGDAGVIVSTFAGPNASVLFDNFAVYTP